MAVYFCDSSAIVKCYVQEQGSAWMVALLDAAAVHHLYLARITGVEVIAVMRRCARLGDIVATDMAAALAQFRQDFSGLYRMIEITPALVHEQWPSRRRMRCVAMMRCNWPPRGSL